MDQRHFPDRLDDLAAQVHRDLQRLNYPPPNWPVPLAGPDGGPALDVLVVGAGMYGQTAAFALYREGIRNIRIIDRAREGEEGPWGTYARMETLRSPKHQNGPDLGIASLTFRAWQEARGGAESWDRLYKIHRLDWLAYMLWVRRTLALPVENGVALTRLSAAGDLLRAELAGAAGAQVVFCRNVVLATGREGAGGRQIPDFPSLRRVGDVLPPHVYHSADDIDFEALRGKTVAILGANASAFDNAATALEHGAAAATMYCRRPSLPQVNKSRWMGFSGFLHGYPALDDAARWRFAGSVADVQMPPPHESVLRCTRHAAFALRFAEPWHDVSPAGDGVAIVTPKGRTTYDAVIFATGFSVGLSHMPELSELGGGILLWGERVGPEEAARQPVLAAFPYLGAEFQLTERTPGICPPLRNIHLLSFGAGVSHGALAGDIPGVSPASVRVAQAISRSLFLADFESYYASMTRFAEPELAPTPYFVPPPRAAAPSLAER